jgi:hypothetical protein
MSSYGRLKWKLMKYIPSKRRELLTQGHTVSHPSKLESPALPLSEPANLTACCFMTHEISDVITFPMFVMLSLSLLNVNIRYV